MVVLSRNPSSVLTHRSNSEGCDPERLPSLKAENKEMPQPSTNNRLAHGCFVVFLLIAIAIPILVFLEPGHEPPTERACETLLSAAKRAYSGQIDYIRRGFTTATASCLLTDFLNALLVHAEKTRTRKDKLVETCISNSFLRTLQFANGSLHSSAKLEREILNDKVGVPLLDHEQLPGDTSIGIAGEEWNRTAAYLSQTRDSRINMSLLTVPSELSIRCDPYTNKTCSEFNGKFPNPLNQSVSAQSLTTQMTSLVSSLVAGGANATQARQLLLHNTAYVYLGTRCHKEDAAKLGVPISFVAEYGRLAGWLANGKMVVDSGKQGLSYKQVQICLPEQVDVLSGYSSAGSVPEKIVGVSGKLEDFVLRLQRSEIEDTAVTTRRGRVSTRDNHASGISTDEDACTAALAAAGPTEVGVGSAVRQGREVCEAGWRYVAGMAEAGSAEAGNCCAEICVTGAEGLGSRAGRAFLTGCCKNCNQASCRNSGPEGEAMADEEKERMERFTLDVPPYGTAKGLTRRIML